MSVETFNACGYLVDRQVERASGTVVPGYEARLVDDAGAPVADDEPGHLLVRGDSIATGKIRRVVVREVVARQLGKPGG